MQNETQTPQEEASMMDVTIWYSNHYHGGDGWRYGTMRCRIPTICPKCGGPRGVDTLHWERKVEDGEFFSVSSWENPCGHVDSYKEVYFEAKALTEGREIHHPSPTRN